MSIVEILKRIDKIILLLVNHDSSHQYLDPVMIVLRNPFTWIPFYIFMVYFFYKQAGVRFWKILIFSLLTVALTDSISTLIKNFFERLRPCYDNEIASLVRHVDDCGGLYSFPSSHAANHFGLAAFWFWIILKLTGKKWKFLWVWSCVICYAQIYIGKHFPSDVIAGGLIGFFTGTFMMKIFSLLELYTSRPKQVYFNIN